MKRIVCIFVVASLFFLVSCGETSIMPPEGTDATTIVTDAAEQATEATTKNNISTTPKINNKFVHVLSRSIETKSKVLINADVTGISTLYYYSKADGEFYPFCFDPLCNHKGKSCIGTLLADYERASIKADHVFFIDDRFYFVSGKKIYSCSEFATDLRVELTFDFKPYWFGNDGNYLLFTYLDDDGGINNIAYDLNSKKLTNMSEKMAEKEKSLDAVLYTYAYNNKKLYMAAYKNVNKYTLPGELNVYVEGDFEGWYVADYEFNSFSKTDNVPPISYTFKSDDGNVEVKNNGETSFDIIYYKFDGTVEKIAEKVAVEHHPIPLYLTDNSYYFWEFDPVVIGYTYDIIFNSKNPRKNNSNGKLYRLDLKTGEIKTVIDDLSIDAFNIIYIDEELHFGLMTLQLYMVEDEYIKTKGGLLYQFKIDENGNFVDLERIALEERPIFD